MVMVMLFWHRDEWGRGRAEARDDKQKKRGWHIIKKGS
jgi:hypothetical protein